MQLPKKYIHDKLILLLASSNIFLAFLCIVSLLLGLSNGTESFIVEYRPNLGIGAFQTGNALDMASFGVFGIIIATLSIILSINTYRVRRALSVLILSSGIILLLMTVVISNALIGLR